MSTEREYCRFNRDPAYAIAIREVPPDGFCLNAFLIVTARDRPRSVLVGRANPAAAWDEIGGLEPKRVHLLSERWMLPSSQLLFGEPPRDAARRLAREQLGIPDLELAGPEVFSESYASAAHPERKRHWDLHFLFRASMPADPVPRSPAFLELAWQDAEGTPASQFARAHNDIVRLAGLRSSDP